ncbi:MAG: zinc-binding dehydrogenase [Candidatus Omnitrophica bacterium]|nr:zinc-binding dehydrogenase [Candidatus Omnitrophota bacterium]
MKAKAVVFPKADSFEVRELELDELGENDVIVKTLVTAISPGTERWILRGKHIGTRFPCVPGYHRVSVVEECGPGVKGLGPGEIVYGCASRWKGEVYSMWGAHMERAVADWRQFTYLSSSWLSRLEIESLSLAIVSGVATRGIRFLEVKEEDRVVIIGAGFIGLGAAQLCVYRNAVALLVEIDQERRKFAESLGFVAISPEDQCLRQFLREKAPTGIDMLYDTVGHAPTTDKLVKFVRRQGKILLQAQYFDREKCAIDLDQIKIREITVKTTCGVSKEDLEETFSLIRRRILNIPGMITHRFEAEDILKGYEILHTGKPFNLGIVFRWDKRVV